MSKQDTSDQPEEKAKRRFLWRIDELEKPSEKGKAEEKKDPKRKDA